MKVLLISPNTEKINMTVMPLGLACVAASVKNAGHDVVLLDLMFEEDVEAALGRALAAFQPGCIGISVRNIDDQERESPRFLLEEVRAVVMQCRALSDAPIVVGGAGYSIFPESVLRYLEADFGIEGEGELAFVELLARLERGHDMRGLPGLALFGCAAKNPPEIIGCPDIAPLPGPDILAQWAAKHPEPWIPVQTRRGCPLKCSYCSTSCIEGTRTRKRSPEQIVPWLQAWVQSGFNRFFFVDNTFNFPPSYAKDLCRLMAAEKLDIRWQAIIYPKGVDRELVELMAEAGCVHISLGFESGALSVLQSMNKHFIPEEVRSISDLFGASGIERMGFLLLGGPGETRDTVEQSLSFADSLHLELINASVGIRIYPNTPLAQTAVRRGMIDRDDSLLQPRFYLEPGLEDWLPERVRQWADARPNVIF